ncbi:T9SS type A sorting domain-containing protein [uncultured Planktosalinus sp.]|uniref:T9SS type A sorting domain-containing protein n=1 Tax=uncultured Planktosalinus sp. TaxID=1810935 RepID=UPI0030D6EE57
MLDKFYEDPDNQVYVDILLEHGIDIPENYLELIENGETFTINSSMFSSGSKVYWIPIKAWIYRENSNPSSNISIANVHTTIDLLNDIFTATNTNIYFYLLCDVGIVNNNNYANFGDEYLDTYWANHHISGAINVHFVRWPKGVNNFEDIWGGIARLPWSNSTPHFVNSIATFGNFSSSIADVLAHEVGHNLGLLHTHNRRKGSANSFNEDANNCRQEPVSRTATQGLFCTSSGDKKCAVNGDKLCDTPADPGLRNPDRNPEYYYTIQNNTCIYDAFLGGTDNWSDTWTPLMNNIMSYSSGLCRNQFTPMQVARMYGYISDIGISHTPFAISGNDALCAGQSATYTVNTLPGVTNYNWEVSSNLTILSGQGTTSVTVQAINHGGGTLTVTPNCGNRAVSKVLTQLFSAPVSGPDTMCVGAAPKYFSTTSYPGATYNWSISNGTILNGQGTNMVQVSVSSHPSNISELYVAVNYCGSPFWGNKLITHVYLGTECNFHSPLPGDQKNSINEDYEFMIYPNPAKTAFTIMTTQDDTFTIEIADKSGIIVYKNNQAHTYETTINTAGFQTGLYFVIINYGSQQQIKRLIIKK